MVIGLSWTDPEQWDLHNPATWPYVNPVDATFIGLVLLQILLYIAFGSMLAVLVCYLALKG